MSRSQCLTESSAVIKMFKIEGTNQILTQGDILWARGFKVVRYAGPRVLRLSRSPFMGLQKPQIPDPHRIYRRTRGFWFLRRSGETSYPTVEFLESKWLAIPRGRELEASEIAQSLWGPVDEDIILFEEPLNYQPRTIYGFSYDREVVVYRALTSFFGPFAYRELLEKARSFCFDSDTWPEALGLYLRGDVPLREYVLHHQGKNLEIWLNEISPKGREVFSLGDPLCDEPKT